MIEPVADVVKPLAMQHPPRLAEFEAMYAGTPAWDIDRPQPVFLALARDGGLRGSVLDVGCGTGEHALLAAAVGLSATGVDASPTAIGAARRKARERGLPATFTVGNVLALDVLGAQFDVVLDSALFHVLDDDDRTGFVASLAAIVPTGGRYFMLCFSDLEPGGWGPRRVSQDDIRAAFADGWRIDTIEPATIELNQGLPPAHSWFASITRS